VSFVVRTAGADDLEAFYAMARSTGGGFTNLPPDRANLRAKLERAASSFARPEDTLASDLYMFVLENTATGAISGTCLIFSQVGSQWPFYSYRMGTLTQYSKELDRTFRAELLSLSTDFDGVSEVGGLFLHPDQRAAGVGKLLARCRYLFIGMHRPRFAGRTIAELRGWQDEQGNSPFWDGLAGRFFGMSFQEADHFNAVHGNQFIADLMPKHPVYTAMLPDSARVVMGRPHDSGLAAMRMLEKEGFVWENYVDIFDGGPTVVAQTDRIATIRDAVQLVVERIEDSADGDRQLLAHGRLADYRAAMAPALLTGTGIVIDRATAAALRVEPGHVITCAPG
jgi:arginine N-succinyltransferase